jgi:clan AA aspartic protease (TIGR02281 family)
MKAKALLPAIIFFLASVNAVSLNAEEILLSHRSGVYQTPVTLNGKVQLEFIIDSGASLVYIPNHIFEQLRANGSISNSDILGKGKSRIANGDIVDTLIINISKLKIGQTEIENVKAAVGGDRSSILLGQSALKRLEPWSLDTQKGILRITSKSVSKKNYVSSSQTIDRTEALDFIHHYLSLQNSRSLNAVIALYAPKVDYLNKGIVPREFVSAQKERYFREWHTIKIDLIKLIEIKEPSSHPKQKMVKFSALFDLYNDLKHKGKSGQTLNTLLLKKEDGSIRIFSEKVKTVAERSY